MIEYIVAALNCFESGLIVKIVEAENWKEALAQHPIFWDGVNWLPDDLEMAKDVAFTADIVFTVVEKIIEEDKGI